MCSWHDGWLKKANFPQLLYLNLSCVKKIDDLQIQDIVKFAGLETLNIYGSYVTEAGIKSVAENLINLQSLDLTGTKCTDLALYHVSRNLTHLTSLIISSCMQITGDGVSSIAENLMNLQSLDLSLTGCTDLALYHVSRKLTHLTSLKLAFCMQITIGGLRSIAEGLTKLEHLCICCCRRLDKNCLKIIYRMPLKSLDHSLEISDELASALKIYYKNRPMSEPPII